MRHTGSKIACAKRNRLPHRTGCGFVKIPATCVALARKNITIFFAARLFDTGTGNAPVFYACDWENNRVSYLDLQTMAIRAFDNS